MVRIAAYAALWMFATGYAVVRGGQPERLGAAILLWLTAGPFIVTPFATVTSLTLDRGAMAVDLIGLAGLLYLALKTDRNWPIWACSAQVIAVTGHLVRFLQLREDPLAYAAMIRAPAYIQCLALLAGTVAYHRRAQKGGSFTFWRT
jgi:hypothetical protein